MRAVEERAGVAVVAALVLLALNLRTIFASLPPLLDEVRGALGLSAAAAGLLTTGPVLCFAVLAPLAPRLTRRVPIERLLVVCGLATAAGAGLRGVGGAAGLFAGTILGGAAVALAQTALPVLVRSRFPAQAGPLTGAFSMSLTLGAAAASGASVPLLHALGGWARSLSAWALPAALAALLWLPVARGGGTVVGGPRGRGVLRDPAAWSLAVYFGLQSAAFYAGLTWLPSILRADGWSAAAAGTLQAVANLVQFGPAFLVPVLAHRRAGQRGILAALVALAASALAGLLAAPSVAPLWMVMLGLAQGAALGLALILPVLRGGDVRTTASLTGMALSVGYGIAALAPWLVGVARDASGGWTLPLVLLLAITAAELPVGLPATRAQTVSATS